LFKYCYAKLRENLIGFSIKRKEIKKVINKTGGGTGSSLQLAAKDD